MKYKLVVSDGIYNIVDIDSDIVIASNKMSDVYQIDFNGFDAKVGYISIQKLTNDYLNSLYTPNQSFLKEDNYRTVFGAMEYYQKNTNSDKIYTQSDMLGLLNNVLESKFLGTSVYIKRKANEYIDSLSKKEFFIEIETEKINTRTGKPNSLSWFNDDGVADEYEVKPKITNGFIKIIKIID